MKLTTRWIAAAVNLGTVRWPASHPAAVRSLPGARRVQPGEHVGRCQVGGAVVVGRKLPVAEDLAPGPGGAPSEERGVVFEQPGGWHGRVRLARHALERGRADQRGPGVPGDGDPEPA